MPVTSSLDPLAMVKALGNLILFEPKIRDNKQDFLTRLYGSNISAIYGKEMTGHYLSEYTPLPTKASMEQYRALLAQKRPFYMEHNAAEEVSTVVRWCRLALPYGTDNNVERILVCNVPIEIKKPNTWDN